MMQKPSDAHHEMHEADIGSGERSPSQQETEEMIRQVPAKPALPSTPPAPAPSEPESPVTPTRR